MAETTDTEEKKLEPRHEIDQIGPCRLKLKIEVSKEKIQERIDHKYKELSESVALAGFRKGHAPRNLLERKFGKAMLDDLRLEIISTAFEEVKEERKLEPLGEPDIDIEKYVVREGEPFSYEITLEVRPTFELKEYAGLKVKKPKVEATEADVERVLKNFQELKAELVARPDQPAEAGDQIVADFQLAVDGKVIDSAENNALFLTESISFYNQAVPDFYKQVLGKKVGETLEYPLGLPASFHDKAYAGKPATIRATLKSVKRKELPVLDDAFAKTFDMDSSSEFRENIRKRVLNEKDQAAREAMAEELTRQLVDLHDFALPEGIIQSGAEEALKRLRLYLAQQGVSPEEIQKRVDAHKMESREGMMRSLKAHFILEQIAQKEKIFVTEDQIEDRIAQMASQYGKWPHEMKAYLEEHGLMPQLRRQMREEQVREFLLSKANMEES